MPPTPPECIVCMLGSESVFASDAFQMTTTRHDHSLFSEREICIQVTANLTPVRSGKGRLPHRDGVT
jgi:hypothetical protein